MAWVEVQSGFYRHNRSDYHIAGAEVAGKLKLELLNHTPEQYQLHIIGNIIIARKLRREVSFKDHIRNVKLVMRWYLR